MRVRMLLASVVAAMSLTAASCVPPWQAQYYTDWNTYIRVTTLNVADLGGDVGHIWWGSDLEGAIWPDQSYLLTVRPFDEVHDRIAVALAIEAYVSGNPIFSAAIQRLFSMVYNEPYKTDLRTSLGRIEDLRELKSCPASLYFNFDTRDWRVRAFC
jgi:hypothetical protein